MQSTPAHITVPSLFSTTCLPVLRQWPRPVLYHHAASWMRCTADCCLSPISPLPRGHKMPPLRSASHQYLGLVVLYTLWGQSRPDLRREDAPLIRTMQLCFRERCQAMHQSRDVPCQRGLQLSSHSRKKKLADEQDNCQTAATSYNTDAGVQNTFLSQPLKPAGPHTIHKTIGILAL